MPEKYSEWSYNITTFSIPRPSKLYPNWDFWFENKPSGNLVCTRRDCLDGESKIKAFRQASVLYTMEAYCGTGDQGCQIFLETIYQNRKKCAK
jgi:hypothetical protein